MNHTHSSVCFCRSLSVPVLDLEAVAGSATTSTLNLATLITHETRASLGTRSTRVTEVLHSRTGLLRTTEEHGVGAGRGTEGELSE